MTVSSKNFVLSYSGGKDCMLAFCRAVQAGHQPVGLLTTYDEEHACSWFHQVPEPILRQASESLDIPLRIVRTQGERYADDFERTLKEFKTQGATTVVFGDIDIQEHRDWCSERCQKAGMESMFPLWQNHRKQVVEEFVDAGFAAIITAVDCARMNERYLGNTLTREILAQLIADGVDACGENGEYHTFVYGGPLFRRPIRFTMDHPVKTEHHIYLPFNSSAEDTDFYG